MTSKKLHSTLCMYPPIAKHPIPALTLRPCVEQSFLGVFDDLIHTHEVEAAESAANIAELNALFEHYSDLIVLFEEERAAEKLEKGKILYNMMLTDSAQASQFTCPSALSTWGWRTAVFRDHYGKVGCDSTHKIPTQHNGRICPVIELARFVNTINVQKGRIEAINTSSPMYADGSKLPPELCRWSDVTFLQWKSIARDTATAPSLKQAIRENIVNKTTCKVIDALTAKHDLQKRRVETMEGEMDGWYTATDTVYRIDEDDALALLGTPNGAGIAYLLIQHRADLGHLAIDYVRLRHIHNQLGETFSLIFDIKPVEIVKARLGLQRTCKGLRLGFLRDGLRREFYG